MDDELRHANDAKKGSPFLTTDQAAHYLGLGRMALEKMRRKNRGPRYRKHGRYVRYHIAELDAWSQLHSHNWTREPEPSDAPNGHDHGKAHV